MLINGINMLHPDEVEKGHVIRFREIHYGDWDPKRLLVMENPRQIDPARWRFWTVVHEEYMRDWINDNKITQIELTVGGPYVDRLIWLVDDFRSSIAC